MEIDNIPTSLKRLVRTVMRGFYPIEHVLVMDMLIRKPCTNEDDLENLLKFDKKYLRQIVQQLQKDKMIKPRVKIETGPDNKHTKQTYWFINYRAFVNVVKYKLDHMRRKIETEERDNTSRSSFVCTECKKTYTDLEVDKLVDIQTGLFNCLSCGALVEEDPSAVPKADSRLVLAKFNQQIYPLDLLLREVEDLVLPSDILEPEPMGDSYNRDGDINRPNATASSNTSVVDSAWTSRRRRPGFDDRLDLTINIEDQEERDARLRREIEEPKNRKEQPKWMQHESDDDNDVGFNHTLNGSSSIANHHHNNHHSHHHKKNHHRDEKDDVKSSLKVAQLFNITDDELGKEILDALMTFERSDSTPDALTKEVVNFLRAPNHHLHHYPNHHDSSSMYSSSNTFNNSSYQNGNVNHHHHHHAGIPNGKVRGHDDDEMMETDEEVELNCGPFVSWKGRRIPLGNVTESMVEEMAPLEREEFIKLAQEVYSYLYD